MENLSVEHILLFFFCNSSDKIAQRAFYSSNEDCTNKLIFHTQENYFADNCLSLYICNSNNCRIKMMSL